MSIIIKMLMSGAAIMKTVTVGYKVIKSTMKRNLRFHKQANKKVKKGILWRDIDIAYPTLHNPHWRKIGKVCSLMIYPVKSSEMPVLYDSFEFRDYGMCRREFETYFWDGMFLVYNKTKGKFEDGRRYLLLRLLTAQLSNTGEVTLSSDSISDTVKLDIDRYRNPSNRFVKETWNGTSETFYGSNLYVNTWVKDSIDIDEINEDVILAQILPRKWDSTRRIRDNWCRFVQGYKTMEEDETGKFITLPRFVLMTIETCIAISREFKTVTPNIVVNTDGGSINPFEEKTWDWIKIGNDVILRNIKPVPSVDEKIQHYGIYCALWSGGNVKINDEVCIYYSDIQHKCKKNIV
nr:PREDICTED: uncharacterized protein LOC105679174 [Linepithema humile]